MDIILNAGDSVKIPTGCTVTERDGMVFFKPVKQVFKNGDFILFSDNDGHDGSNRVVILNKIINNEDNGLYYYAMFAPYDKLYINNKCSARWAVIRHATDSEKQILLDKLHENGKDWDAKKCEIVDLKYVPKVGDCLKLEHCNSTTFIECSGLEDGKYPCGYKHIISLNEVMQNNYVIIGYKDHWKYTKITREELQAEFNKLGYEYDFNTHTAKKIEWRPKLGEAIWYLGHDFNNLIVESEEFDGVKGDINVFRTRKLAEAALELLKNAKHY